MNNDIHHQAVITPLRASDRLFGREHDLESVTAMLRSAECRLVTLSGPGGIGKTSLARCITELLLPDFEDGVFFIPLQALTSAQQVASATLEQLDINGTDDPSEQLLHALQDRCLLLVLDNFEHLLDARKIVTAFWNKPVRSRYWLHHAKF